MMRLVAAHRWEALLIVGVACFYPPQAWIAAVTPPGGEWIAFAALLSLPAVGMLLLYAGARRREHGLEFLLVVGIPFAAYLAGVVFAVAPFLALLIPWFRDYGNSGLFPFLAFAFAIIPGPFTAAVLLAIGRRYVRRRPRGFLNMAWIMLLAVALFELAGAAYEVAASQFFPPSLFALRFGYAVLPAFFIVSPLTMLLALWFARQASRISLAHAFFIVGLAFAFPVSRLLMEISPNDASDSPLRIAALTVARTSVATFSLAATLAIVWLLGNFDRRGPAFNARAAAALFGIKAVIGVAAAIPLIAQGGATVARHPPLVIGVFAGWGVTLALVHLLRVRQPAPAPGSA